MGRISAFIMYWILYYITNDCNEVNNERKIAILTKKNKLFTEITQEIRGGIYKNYDDIIIYGFLDCCVHSLTANIKLAFSEHNYPYGNKVNYYIPIYSSVNDETNINSTNHQYHCYPGIRLRVIFNNNNEDIHGSMFDQSKYKLLRIRKNTPIYVNRNNFIY